MIIILKKRVNEITKLQDKNKLLINIIQKTDLR